MRRLIITADDLGANAQRNHGIFQCREFGVVTNTLLLPNFPESAAAGKHARERSVPTGLQLCLTEEYPLSNRSDIESLLEGNGMFLSLEKFERGLSDESIREEHLEREIRAQVEWFFDTVGSPTHIAGHHHIHVRASVAKALIPVMERYGIRFMRMPIEEPLPPFGYIIPDDELARTRTHNEEAKKAKKMYLAYGIEMTDHFRGLTLSGNASLKNLRHIIGRLPGGVTELMVHPGSAISFGTPFDLDPQRQTELRMLLDPTIPGALAQREITLCSFADI